MYISVFAVVIVAAVVCVNAVIVLVMAIGMDTALRFSWVPD